MASNEIFKLVGRILIENADALEAIDDTTEKAKTLGETLEGTGKTADQTGTKLGSSGKLGSGSVWFGNMMTKLTDWGIKAGEYIAKTGIGFNANIEAYENQFASMLGDVDRAKQLVADIQKLAKDTPLGMEGLVVNATSLLGAGVEVDDMIDKLTMLGNIARGDKNAMTSVTKAYRDVMGKGKLMAQELYQFTEAGVNLVKLVTDYGGKAYADGGWYGDMMRNPKDFAISFDVVDTAFRNATAAGATYHDYMFNMMDTWLGQTDRMGEEGKESLGSLTKPLFDVLKSDALPKLAESLALFGTWASENQDTLTKWAEGIGKFATITFDGALDFFKWITENGEAVAVAIGAIGTAMGIAAVTAHPYAAAVTAVAGALMLLNSEGGQKRGTFDHMFDGYTNEQLQTLNAYVDAMNALKEAEDAALADTSGNSWGKYDEMYSAYEAALEDVKSIEGLLATYNTWHGAQEGYAGANGPALKVQLRPDDNAETDMQADIDQMAMEATVELIGDTSGLQADVNRANLTARVGLFGIGSTGIDGSHAGGLDYVPYDGYIAQLHKGESVLTSVEASAWRGGSSGNVESLLSQVVALLAQQKNVVLDSGAVVGQLAPAMDARLGTISSRKGRRN